MKRNRVTFGSMTFEATSIDVTEKRERDPIVFSTRVEPIGKTRGTYSFTAEATGAEFDAFARLFDVVALPASMDLSLNFKGGDGPIRLRVLREHETVITSGGVGVEWIIFHGPRLADGRWTRTEAPR